MYTYLAMPNNNERSHERLDNLIIQLVYSILEDMGYDLTLLFRVAYYGSSCFDSTRTNEYSGEDTAIQTYTDEQIRKTKKFAQFKEWIKLGKYLKVPVAEAFSVLVNLISGYTTDVRNGILVQILQLNLDHNWIKENLNGLDTDLPVLDLLWCNALADQVLYMEDEALFGYASHKRNEVLAKNLKTCSANKN